MRSGGFLWLFDFSKYGSVKVFPYGCYGHMLFLLFVAQQVAALGELEVAKILEGFNRLSVRGEWPGSWLGNEQLFSPQLFRKGKRKKDEDGTQQIMEPVS